MDFIDSAQILISALKELNVTVWEQDDQPLAEFQKRFCFIPQAQSLYTVDGIKSFFTKKDGSHIYIVSDALDTFCTLIKVDNRWVILGPYVASDWKENAAKILLAKCGVSQSAFLAFKMYRCGLPLISQGEVTRIAATLLIHTVGNTPPHELERVEPSADKVVSQLSQISGEYEGLEIVNQRYALENQFEKAIRQGRTAEALNIMRESLRLNVGFVYVSDDMKDQVAVTTLIRTLVRRAALQAGMTPIAIDTLSQEYAQRMNNAIDKAQLKKLLDEYVAAFCAVIRTNNATNYSIHVGRAVQYIEGHINQNISTDFLCQQIGISKPHFIQLFKRETGKTVSQFIKQSRCELAAELLVNSKLQIQEIGRYIGYDDTNYFTRIFKKIMGVSPQEYRDTKTIYKF